MVQAPEQPLSFEDFLDQYPENGGRYELIEGEVVEVRPTGPHENIGGFIALKLGVLIDRNNLPFTIPRTCVVKPERPNAGYIPDVAVLDARESKLKFYERAWRLSQTIGIALK